MTGLIKPTRRGFLLGLSALIAAPVIVRAASLMPVKSFLGDGLGEVTIKTIEPFAFPWDGRSPAFRAVYAQEVLRHYGMAPWLFVDA